MNIAKNVATTLFLNQFDEKLKLRLFVVEQDFFVRGFDKRSGGESITFRPRLPAQILSAPLHSLNNFPGQMSM